MNTLYIGIAVIVVIAIIFVFISNVIGEAIRITGVLLVSASSFALIVTMIVKLISNFMSKNSNSYKQIIKNVLISNFTYHILLIIILGLFLVLISKILKLLFN